MPLSNKTRKKTPRKVPLFLSLALTLAAGTSPAGPYSIGEEHTRIRLPDLGDPSGAVLSPLDEQRLGEAFMREVRSRVSLADEPEVVSYLNDLGYRLASHGESAASGGSTNFTFFIVKDSAINAFAVPGGFIGVNAGLILATETESELAAVLAHEIVHVSQHHAARSMALAKTMHPLAMAGMLAAIIVGTQSSQAGQAAITAVAAGSIQKQINFTRANEHEADRLGIGTLFAAGFDPKAMPIFFERLQTAHRYYSEPPEFLSTHPVTVSRIADSRGRAEQYPYRQYTDSPAYHLVRASLAVTMEKDPQKSIRTFEDALKNQKHQNPDGARYGLALASLAAGDWKRARAEINKLRKKEPENVTFQARLAEIELSAGHVQKAIGLYQDALLLYPDNKLLIRGYARALLEGNRPGKVIALLDRRDKKRAQDPDLQELLAKAFFHKGEKIAANAALAEHYYLNGDLDAAIRQMRMALKLPEQDYYQSARIEARLQQFEEEQNLRKD
uniref:Putative beta-barrel assembly-enhancing protease n=1 Tax=Candidatus Kentrum sp. DK TaxID=2126562 RepID=A0A450SHX0_9GAMM|nr:MAG: Putative Zn-dependent protease, contains TPR repeats [Candidatus Kentron sp. DK]VFJ52856.1 MAG: Putative Zn-dependent protease, contains TPR repeats [Candidatus Kentron sp. DK]